MISALTSGKVGIGGAAIVVLVLWAAGMASSAGVSGSPREKELSQKMMCVCGCGEVLAYCNHVGCAYSHAMIKEIDDRITRGESDSLILQSFVQEYGPAVLSEPPAKGFDWAAWIVPIVAPIIALFLVWEVVRRWRVRAALAPAGGPAVSPELLERARREAERSSHE